MVKLANGWTLRLRQEECHDKLINAYKNGGKEFLIAAVCRFGKTITTLQSLRDLADETGNDSQVIVVLCTMNVKKEWADACERTGFDKTYCETPVNDIDFSSIGSTGRHVVYVSTQKLGNGSDKSNELIEWFNSHSGLKTLVYDECHLGSGTDRTKNNIIDRLNFDNKVYLSGTPYRNHLRQEFEFDKCFGEEKCYIYSMTDERDDYNNGNITDYTPVQLELSILDYQKEIEASVNEDGEVDKFTRTYGVSYVFFKKLFSEPGMEHRAKEFFDKIIDFCKTKDVYNGLFYVPVRQVGRDLVKLAKKLNVNIKFMSLCGGAGNGQETDEMAESDAQRLNNFYSASNPNNEIRIGITCNKCGTGTTLKDLDFVAFLKETTNAVSFIQQSQRCRTPKSGKEKAYVLCFNQWSGLKAFCDYAKASYNDNSMSDAEKIKKAFENGAVALTLNLTENIDYEHVIDFMSCYHPGEELFTDIDFTGLLGFDFFAFTDATTNSFDGLKDKLKRAHPELRNDPNFNNAKTVNDLNAVLGQHDIDDIRKIFQETYINVILEMYDYGLTEIAQFRDYDNYDDYIVDVLLNGELHISLDGWKDLNNIYTTYIPKIINYYVQYNEEEDAAEEY